MKYLKRVLEIFQNFHEIFTGRQRSCKLCTSYDRDVHLSVRLSVCLSVRHTLALSENDAS